MVLLALPFLWSSQVNVDELDEHYNALRQLQGQIPYVDFHDFVPPSPQWLCAAIFVLAGPGVLATRIVQLALLLVAGGMMYGLARRLDAPPRLALAPGILLVAALYRAMPAFDHHWVALLGLLAVPYGLVRAFEADRPAWALAAGLGAALAVTSTQSDGGLAVALGCAALLIAWVAKLPRVGLVAGGAIAGLAALLVPMTLVLWLRGALPGAWHDLVVWGLGNYKTVGGFNDISLWHGLQDQLASLRADARGPFGLPRAVFLLELYTLVPLGLAAGLIEVRAASAPLKRGLAGLLVLLTAGQAVLCVVGRADANHVAMYSVGALVLAAVGAARIARSTASEGARFAPTLALVAFGLAGYALVVRAIVIQPADFLSPTPPDQRLAAQPVPAFVRAHSTPSDRIVSVPWGGPHYFYGRPAAVAYTLMMPPQYGYNSPREYAAMHAALLASRPKLVIVQMRGGPEHLGEAWPGFDLPGYRLVATLPTYTGFVTFDAHCFERMDALPAKVGSHSP